MNADVFFALVSAGLTIVVFVLVSVLVRTRERMIRAETALAYMRPDRAIGSDRVEAALDAVALDVERLAEGQRFVARVLSERAGKELMQPSAHRPVITPH